jgi:CyaY protein
MANDHEFGKTADAVMDRVLRQLETFDPDELDCDLAMGVLSMTFADETKCILNRQTAAHQIWLAQGASAWHFAIDAATGRWLDTKGRGELTQVLSAVLSAKLGKKVELSDRDLAS